MQAHGPSRFARELPGGPGPIRSRAVGNAHLHPLLPFGGLLMRRIGSVFALLALFSLGACGSSSSSGDPGPTDGGSTDGGGDGGGTVTADQACADLAAAYCDRSFACAALYSDITYADAAT